MKWEALQEKKTGGLLGKIETVKISTTSLPR